MHQGSCLSLGRVLPLGGETPDFERLLEIFKLSGSVHSMWNHGAAPSFRVFWLPPVAPTTSRPVFIQHTHDLTCSRLETP